MSSPDKPVIYRRRRRSRRPAGADGQPVETDRPADADESGTARRPDRDEAARRNPIARQNPTARRGREAKSAGQRRQSDEPSARTIRETERGWRDLAGSGASQLGVSGALRARDVARPGPDELAAAERTVQLVRRQWQPPAAD